MAHYPFHIIKSCFQLAKQYCIQHIHRFSILVDKKFISSRTIRFWIVHRASYSNVLAQLRHVKVVILNRSETSIIIIILISWTGRIRNIWFNKIIFEMSSASQPPLSQCFFCRLFLQSDVQSVFESCRTCYQVLLVVSVCFVSVNASKKFVVCLTRCIRQSVRQNTCMPT